MRDIVMAEYEALRAGTADAFDHGIVVEGVGKDRAAWQQAPERTEGGEVRYPPRCEDQRSFLAVQIGKLGLELHVRQVGSGNIASPAGARTRAFDRSMHGRQHVRVLTHAEIVVAAPHR